MVERRRRRALRRAELSRRPVGLQTRRRDAGATQTARASAPGSADRLRDPPSCAGEPPRAAAALLEPPAACGRGAEQNDLGAVDLGQEKGRPRRNSRETRLEPGGRWRTGGVGRREEPKTGNREEDGERMEKAMA